MCMSCQLSMLWEALYTVCECLSMRGLYIAILLCTILFHVQWNRICLNQILLTWEIFVEHRVCEQHLQKVLLVKCGIWCSWERSECQYSVVIRHLSFAVYIHMHSSAYHISCNPAMSACVFVPVYEGYDCKDIVKHRIHLHNSLHYQSVSIPPLIRQC